MASRHRAPSYRPPQESLLAMRLLPLLHLILAAVYRPEACKHRVVSIPDFQDDNLFVSFSASPLPSSSILSPTPVPAGPSGPQQHQTPNTTLCPPNLNTIYYACIHFGRRGIQTRAKLRIPKQRRVECVVLAKLSETEGSQWVRESWCRDSVWRTCEKGI